MTEIQLVFSLEAFGLLQQGHAEFVVKEVASTQREIKEAVLGADGGEKQVVQD